MPASSFVVLAARTTTALRSNGSTPLLESLEHEDSDDWHEPLLHVGDDDDEDDLPPLTPSASPSQICSVSELLSNALPSVSCVARTSPPSHFSLAQTARASSLSRLSRVPCAFSRSAAQRVCKHCMRCANASPHLCCLCVTKPCCQTVFLLYVHRNCRRYNRFTCTRCTLRLASFSIFQPSLARQQHTVRTQCTHSRGKRLIDAFELFRTFIFRDVGGIRLLLQVPFQKHRRMAAGGGEYDQLVIPVTS
ncbi:hypothetical protein F5148DRAFT_666656 [Russula earlei]|uniref:Uncharacterized protein n=1 Tax=Russula earlei TaxID=71964 RepID=A0ACC0UE30_9AGAM|nr:hypothetical protein F5148DRAFT_666656 [Russula earlei]